MSALHPALADKMLFVREMEGALKLDKPILTSAISRPFYTKVFPQSGGASYPLALGTMVLFRLPQTGYLSPGVAAEGYFEFAVTITNPQYVSTWVEPYSFFTRVDQLINQNNINPTALRRDKLAAMRVLDSCNQQLLNIGSVAGVAAQPPTAPGEWFQAANSTSHPGYFPPNATTTKWFSIPLKWLCDGLIVDRDSVINMNYVSFYQLQFQMTDPSFCAWSSNSNTTAAVASPAITVGSMQIVLPLVYVDDAEDAKVRAAIDGEGLVYNTEVVVANPQAGYTLGNGGSSASTTVLFGALPKSVKYLETVIEGSTQTNNINCAYKELTQIQAGISSYQYLLDSKPVPDLPVYCQATQASGGTTPLYTEGYRQIMEEVHARKRSELDQKNISGVNYDLLSWAGSRYLSAYAGSSGAANNQYLSAFKMGVDLSSVSRELFSGTRVQTLQLQIQYTGNAGYYDSAGTGTVNAAITACGLVMFAYCNRGCVITRGSYAELY